MKSLKCNKCGKEITKRIVTCPECNSSLIDEWTAAAEAGSSEAQDFLAWCYYEGNGVEKDDDQAAKWWSLAAAQGNIAATNSLGGCHYRGLGMEKDAAKAVGLFRIAAEQGFVKAQYNMGLCYRLGNGVEKDLDEAAKWYGMAAEQGDLPSIKALEEVEKEKEEETPDEAATDTEAEELYETHGNHIDAIMDPNVFATDYLGKVVGESSIYKTVETDMLIEKPKAEPVKLFALLYGDEEFGLISLIASNNRVRSNIFASLFPILKGNRYEAEIEKVSVWSNQIEATVKVSIGERSISFFATDYYCNKEKYVAGKRINVSLAALGMKIEKGSIGFDFQGQQALDFLAKTEWEPEYDEQGNVKPLHFNMECLEAYLALDDKCPDEAVFQSPATGIGRCSLLDIDFVKCHISFTIDDERKTISIPLYFRESFIPDIAERTPVSGSLWLTGCIA